MSTAALGRLFTVVVLAAGTATSVAAQEPEPTSRETAIEQAQAEKVKTCQFINRLIGGNVEKRDDRTHASGM